MENQDYLYKDIENSLIKHIKIDEFDRIFIYFENGKNYTGVLSQDCKVIDEKADKIREFLKKNPDARNENQTHTKI